MKPLSVLILAVVGIASCFWLYTSSAHYESSLDTRYQPSIPMTFDHQTHGKEQCIDCHHNFTDNSGQGLCIECHLTDESIKAVFEQQFHDLCMGCHEKKQLLGEDHGPIRRCIECHTIDQLP